MFPQFNKFYSPDDSETITPGLPNAGDTSEVIKFLEDEPTEETIPLKKEKTEKEEEVTEEDETEDETEDEGEEDELEALVEDLEPPTEEQLELTTPVRRREILKKYPTLFKDFPYLEKAYYREQQFTELLPTIQDAKEAVEKGKILDRFETDLMGGNTETILRAVKENDEKGFLKIVDDYLPTLAKVDEKAYHHVLGTTIKHTIMAMVNEGRRSGNDALSGAAEIVNQFVFGTSEFENPTKLSKDTGPDENVRALQNKERELNQRQFDTARNELDTRVNNSIRSTIEANIDPKNSMSDYVRKNAVREATENLNQLMSGNKRSKEIIDRLWENAFKSNFNKDSIDKIRSAHLSVAKTLLLSVIKKARIEALKGTGRRVRETDDSDKPSDKRPVTTGKPRSQETSGKIKKASDIPAGMRSIDFLMQD